MYAPIPIIFYSHINKDVAGLVEVKTNARNNEELLKTALQQELSRVVMQNQ